MRKFVQATMILTLGALAALPAFAQTIRAGNDGWKTPGGGQTTIDLSGYPDVLGSPIAGGSKVSLKGVPLDSANLGSIDTLLERSQTTLSGGSGTATLRVVALSLTSENNIVLQDGRQYRLDITLSDNSKSGSINLKVANVDGGTFSSSFPVVAKLTFTGGDTLTIDCGVSGGCPANTVSSNNSGWVTALGGHFDPAAKGVTPIKAGLTVQGYKTIGSNSDFTAGFTASAPQNFPAAPISEADRWAMHQVGPALDCQPAGGGVGTASAAVKRDASGKVIAQPVKDVAVCKAVATPVGD